jgi:quaternary ammonium compound-resistance protein SugE
MPASAGHYAPRLHHVRMHWTLLLIAAALEIIWAVGLKLTDGFTRLWPSVGVIAAMAGSMVFLSLAARGLPIGTAYAIWTGIGAVGTVIAGIFLFDETVSLPRILCLVVIIGGVIGLRFFGK